MLGLTRLLSVTPHLCCSAVEPGKEEVGGAGTGFGAPSTKRSAGAKTGTVNKRLLNVIDAELKVSRRGRLVGGKGRQMVMWVRSSGEDDHLSPKQVEKGLCRVW